MIKWDVTSALYKHVAAGNNLEELTGPVSYAVLERARRKSKERTNQFDFGSNDNSISSRRKERLEVVVGNQGSSKLKWIQYG